MDIAGYKLREESKEVGRFSTIFSAVDERYGRAVLIKVFNKEVSTTQSFRSHFKSVMQKLLKQPLGSNVRVFDSKMYDDACVFVMEHHSYCSVEACQRLRLSKTQALEVGRQIASSLSLLHNQKIVHGGIELSNVSISDDGKAVLGPVALQRTIPGRNTFMLLVDQVEDIVYRAPEANAGLTVSTDFYALGVLLYELLLGRKPFESKSVTRLRQEKEKGRYLPLDKEYRYLTPLFKKMLSPDPKLRISSVYEFDFILSQCEGSASTQDSAFPADEVDFFPDKNVNKKTPIPIKKTGMLRTLMIGISIAAVLGFLVNLFLSSKTPVGHESAGKVAVLDDVNDHKAVQLSPQTVSSSKPEIDPNSLYKRVTSLIEADDYIAALQLIKDASPDDVDAKGIKRLKTDIEKEIEIRSLLETAKSQIDAAKLIRPPGNNALETYQQIILLGSEGDARANEGIAKIASNYLGRAKQRAEMGRYDDAKKMIESGLQVSPSHRELLALKASLATRKSDNSGSARVDAAGKGRESSPQSPKVVPSLKVATADVNQGRKAAKSTSQAEFQAESSEEKPQVAFVDKREPAKKLSGSADVSTGKIEEEVFVKKDAVSAWKHKLESIGGPEEVPVSPKESPVTTEKAPPKDNKINTDIESKDTVSIKIASVERALLPGQLSFLSLQAATNEYYSLKQSAGNKAEISGLHDKILGGYVDLARKQEKANQLPTALETIDKGLGMNARHKQLLAMKNRIISVLRNIERWKKAAPIIGAF